MPGKLRCDRIDLSAPATVGRLLEILAAVPLDTSYWSPLDVSDKYYFTIPGGNVPSVAGWYVICDEVRRPLYVGTAENLAARLNSKDGSRDNFANPRRTHDPVRNFIKSFRLTGIVPGLWVLLIPEAVILDGLDLSGGLSDLDRCNVEKVIDLFREKIVGHHSGTTV